MEIRAGADIAVKEKQLVVKWIKRCLREITKAAYELPVDYPTARSDIRITIKGAGHRSSACAKASPSISCLSEGSTPMYWNIRPLQTIG